VSPTHFLDYNKTAAKSLSFTESDYPRTAKASSLESLFRTKTIIDRGSIFSFLDTTAVHVQLLNNLGTPRRERANSKLRVSFSKGLSPVKPKSRQTSFDSSHHAYSDISEEKTVSPLFSLPGVRIQSSCLLCPWLQDIDMLGEHLPGENEEEEEEADRETRHSISFTQAMFALFKGQTSIYGND